MSQIENLKFAGKRRAFPFITRSFRLLFYERYSVPVEDTAPDFSRTLQTCHLRMVSTHFIDCPVIILPLLYGCETWSLILREERNLRVFGNMVLRRIFGPRRDEVTGEWRRLHNEKLNDLYCSSNIVRVIKSRRMRWAGHVARMGEERGGV